VSTKHGDVLCVALADLFERDAKQVADTAPKFAATLKLRAKQLRAAAKSQPNPKRRK
jgi:hypothetical protein